MPVKSYKPTTPSRRYMKTVDFSILTKKKPEKSLLLKARKATGRSKTTGRITSRHRGGGNSKRYRLVDFKRNKYDAKAEVVAIEYDPNRTAFIALIKYEDGEKSYIIAPESIKVGDKIVPEDVLNGILGFFLLYIGIFIVSSLFMALLGLDMITAISSVAATLGNVGPGLGTVGPTDNYIHIPFLGKWLLSLCMLIGRLEIYTVMVLLIPAFWKK